MKHLVWLLFFLLHNVPLQAQENEAWTAFWNNDTTRIGFKDAAGETVIPPTFMGLTMAHRLEHIMAAMEMTSDGIESYYLTKSLKIVARDSLYFWDNASDCESEGFIRFHDKDNDMVGMLNRDGEVAISAEYNMLSRVMNGMVVALKGAKKQYDKHKKHTGCKHYRWKGGKTYIIDTANHILVKNFSVESDLDFYSISKHPRPSDDPEKENFLGVDGQYYTFVNFTNDFKTWFFTDLMQDFSIEKLIDVTHDSVTYWNEEIGWLVETGKDFAQRNLSFMNNEWAKLQNDQAEYHVFIESLNPYIFTSAYYQRYFNNCLEGKGWQYPVMDLVINHTRPGDFYQNSYQFLKTESGYKMISASIRNKE